jgi:hypothetical protein
LKWLVLDMIPITMIDATGLYTADEVADTLRAQGVVLAAAGRQTEWNLWAESRKRAPHERKIPICATLGEGIEAYRSTEVVSASAK